jgi:ribonuclease HI
MADMELETVRGAPLVAGEVKPTEVDRLLLLVKIAAEGIKRTEGLTAEEREVLFGFCRQLRGRDGPFAPNNLGWPSGRLVPDEFAIDVLDDGRRPAWYAGWHYEGTRFYNDFACPYFERPVVEEIARRWPQCGCGQPFLAKFEGDVFLYVENGLASYFGLVGDDAPEPLFHWKPGMTAADTPDWAWERVEPWPVVLPDGRETILYCFGLPFGWYVRSEWEASQQPPVWLYTAGAARGEPRRTAGHLYPGAAAVGFLVVDESGTVLAEHAECIGVATDNEAEYSGLIAGLTACRRLTSGPVRWVSGSDSVVEQVVGAYRLRELLDELRTVEAAFSQVTYGYRPRAEPHIARVDRLVNAALDAPKRQEPLRDAADSDRP